MAVDPRKDAQEYIAEKRVDILFQELGTRLVFERPEDPNAFLLSVSNVGNTTTKEPGAAERGRQGGEATAVGDGGARCVAWQG